MIGWAPASYSNKNIVHFFSTEMIVFNKPCERSKILWHSDSIHLLWSCVWGKENVTLLIKTNGCPSAIFEIVREGYGNRVRAWLTFTFHMISKTTNWWLRLRRNTSSPFPSCLDTPTIVNRDLNDEKVEKRLRVRDLTESLFAYSQKIDCTPKRFIVLLIRLES